MSFTNDTSIRVYDAIENQSMSKASIKSGILKTEYPRSNSRNVGTLEEINIIHGNIQNVSD